MKKDDFFTRWLKSTGALRDAPPTLAEFITENAAEGFDLSPQLVWEAATKIYGRSGGEAVCPPSICEFVAEIARRNRVEDVLDPFVGYGSMLETLIRRTAPRTVTAMSPNPAVIAAARQVLSGGSSNTLFVGDVHGEQLQNVSPVDVVVSAPPFGVPSRAFTIADTEVRDDAGHELLLRACLKLRADGVGVFVVVPRILSGRSRGGVLSVLSQFDLHLDAYFHVPTGAFTPFALIETAVVVIRRGPAPERIFVGELVEDEGARRTLLSNYVERVPGSTPKLGALVALDDFRSLARLEFDARATSISRQLGYEPVALRDLAERIERCPTSPEDLAVAPNSLFIPLPTAANATTDPTELRSLLRDAAHVVLRPEHADARVVARFLNTGLGRELRASRATGNALKRMQLADVGDLPLWLPDVQTQRAIVRFDQEVALQTERLREIGEALWTRMSPAGLPEITSVIAREESYLDWLDSLPFPLASILWAHHGMPPQATTRYERLLFFFEALAEFLATFLMSGARADAAFFAGEWQTIRTTLASQGASLERASFGTWIIILERLAKSMRRMVDADDDGRERWCTLLAIEDPTLLDAVLSSKMVALLKDANRLRNTVRHGGAIGEHEAELRESLLRSALVRFRQLVGTRWTTAPLVLPGRSRYARGLHHYTAHLVMGTRSPFAQQEIAVRRPLEDGTLHIVSPRTGAVCQLMPFVQMGPPPQGERTACYFFNRGEGDQLRLVSYHHDARPELVADYPEIRDLLDELRVD